MDDDEPPITKFDADRAADDLDTQVRCPRCNKRMFMHATRCPHCSVNFNGEAWQFSPSMQQPSSPRFFGIPRWLVAAIVIVVVFSLLLAYL